MDMRIVQMVLFVTVLLFCGCERENSADLSIPRNGTTPIVAAEHNSSKQSIGTKSVNANKKHTFTVLAYYFHRTVRCPTCIAIEADAENVIRNNFAQQLSEGQLLWMPVNLDEPGGEEFEKEFDISGSTFVIAKMKDGHHIRYKKLEKVWQLIGNEETFSDYIIREVKEYLQ